jgi:hypothetical protein
VPQINTSARTAAGWRRHSSSATCTPKLSPATTAGGWAAARHTAAPSSAKRATLIAIGARGAGRPPWPR